MELMSANFFDNYCIQIHIKNSMTNFYIIKTITETSLDGKHQQSSQQRNRETQK